MTAKLPGAPKGARKKKVDKAIARMHAAKARTGVYHTEEEIAAEVGCSRQRIGQITAEALKKVRRKLELMKLRREDIDL